MENANAGSLAFPDNINYASQSSLPLSVANEAQPAPLRANEAQPAAHRSANEEHPASHRSANEEHPAL